MAKFALQVFDLTLQIFQVHVHIAIAIRLGLCLLKIWLSQSDSVDVFLDAVAVMVRYLASLIIKVFSSRVNFALMVKHRL